MSPLTVYLHCPPVLGLLSNTTAAKHSETPLKLCLHSVLSPISSPSTSTVPRDFNSSSIVAISLSTSSPNLLFTNTNFVFGFAANASPRSLTDAGLPMPYVAGGTRRYREKERAPTNISGRRKARIQVVKKCRLRLMIRFLRTKAHICPRNVGATIVVSCCYRWCYMLW